MARPRTPIGTYGRINTHQIANNKWEASARFRTRNGKLPRVKRRGTTKAKAENSLKKAMTKLAEASNAGNIASVTRFKTVAAKYVEELEGAVFQHTRSPNTLTAAITGLNHILPTLGELSLIEIDTPLCEEFITAKRSGGMKYELAQTMRSALSNVLGFAVRRGAMTANPMKEVSRLERGTNEYKDVVALTLEQRIDLFKKLDVDPEAKRQDVPDLLRAMLSTGVRISEILACVGGDVSRDTATGRTRLLVNYRIVLIRGQGLERRRRSRTSTKGGGQVLLLPEWAGPLFAARKLAAGPGGPLFPNPHGVGWRSPRSHTTVVLRKALDAAGYPWVTSHVMRKTAATVGALAGVPTQDISDGIGQKTTRITREHYIASIPQNASFVRALDGMFEESGPNLAP